MGPYHLDYSREAEHELAKMERTVAKRIMDKLDDACQNPDHFFERLSGREDYKLRVGDYRVLCLVEHGERIVFVQSMDHRKRIYKRRA